MLETPHSMIGAGVGAATGNPYLAVPAGIVSHFAGDMMPHWDAGWPFKSKWFYALAIGDFIVAEAFVVFCWFAFPDRPEIAVGAFAGTLPDLILGVRYIFRVRWLRSYERFHAKYHWWVPIQYGLWPQLILSGLALWYLTTLS